MLGNDTLLTIRTANARCNLGQSRSTPQCTPTLLSKQHVELFHTDRVTNSYSGSFKVIHLGTTEKAIEGLYILHVYPAHPV